MTITPESSTGYGPAGGRVHLYQRVSPGGGENGRRNPVVSRSQPLAPSPSRVNRGRRLPLIKATVGASRLSHGPSRVRRQPQAHRFCRTIRGGAVALEDDRLIRVGVEVNVGRAWKQLKSALSSVGVRVERVSGKRDVDAQRVCRVYGFVPAGPGCGVSRHRPGSFVVRRAAPGDRTVPPEEYASSRSRDSQRIDRTSTKRLRRTTVARRAATCPLRRFPPAARHAAPLRSTPRASSVRSGSAHR